MKSWLENHKTAFWSGLVVFLLLILLPLTIYLFQQRPFGFPQAWVCNSVQAIDNNDGTYNLVVTDGSAGWWRIVRLSDSQVMAGPQSAQVFDQVALDAGDYQVQASDNQQDWTNQGCVFNIEGVTYTLQCNDIKLYTPDWDLIDLSEIYIGDVIRVAIGGTTTEPQGITKARFSFDNGLTWIETTDQIPNGEFYVEWTVPDEASVGILSQVFNPVLGWR